MSLNNIPVSNKRHIARTLAAGAALAAVWAISAQTAPPRLEVSGGEIEGELAGRGAVFKGVPFAQPPVRNLRWREPMPVTAWRGLRETRQFAPGCVQNGRGGPTGSEDCLYLNVWLPEWPVRGVHPAMVWLYGGANATGTAASPAFDGVSLARRGVIVVTANYRVGAMGFMAHPELTAESTHHFSGNYGLLDALAALGWVRDNAVRIGADPARVTLFGQSSGSFDTQVLMTSPLAKGLFTRAIAESGQLLSFNGSMPRERAEGIGVRIAEQLHAPADHAALAFLRSLPATDVAAAAAKFLPTDLASDTGLLTNVDGWVLPQPPDAVFAAGKEMPVPLIVGNNAREIAPNLAPDELRRQIRAKYGAFADKALAAYGLAGDGPGKTDPLHGNAGTQWMTDIVQRCAANTIAHWHAGSGFPTWQYQFELPVSSHGAEVPYVFGTLGPGGDRQASDTIESYWTNLAKAGTPNGDGLIPWPKADGWTYVAFTSAGPVVRQNLQAEACAPFREWTLARMGVYR